MSRIITEYPVESLGDEDDYHLLVTEAKQLVRERPAALKFELDGVGTWVPRSVCRQDHRGIWVAEWFVEKEGLDG